MKYFSILFLLLGFLSFAQEKQFSGIIVADSISFTQVNIVNLNKELGTVNNKKGEFIIDADAGDEIVFSSIQFEPYQITVNDENLNMLNTIYLFPIVNELDEVKISDNNLSGDLLKDAANIKVDSYFSPSQVGLPNPAPKLTVEDRRLYTANSGGPVGVLVDVLSGRMAMLNRMKAIAEYESLIGRAKRLVSKKYIVEDLKIPEEFVDDFFYFISKDERFSQLVKSEDELDMVKFITDKKKEYFIFKEWE